MNLRTKLFFSIGILLILVAVTIYFFSDYLIGKQMTRAIQTIRVLLRNEEQRMEKTQSLLLEKSLYHTKTDIDALFNLIYTSEDFAAFQKSDLDLWTMASKLLGYDPDIGSIQFTEPSKEESAVIVQGNAHFYSFDLYPFGNDFLWIILHPKPADQESHSVDGAEVETESLTPEESSMRENSYVAIPIDLMQSDGKENSYYALIHWQDLLSLSSFEQWKETPFQRGLRKAFKTLEEKIHPKEPLSLTELVKRFPPAHIAHAEVAKEEVWAHSIEMIQKLAPLFAEGEKLKWRGDKFFPAGLLHLDKGNKGEVILSKDIFRLDPLYDDRRYFAEHPPSESIPIAKGILLYQDAPSETVYLGRVLRIRQRYLTLTASLNEIVQSAARTTSRIVIASTPFGWIGYTVEGEKITKEELQTLPVGILKEAPSGTMHFMGVDFAFNRLLSLPDWKLSFYLLNPKIKELSLASTLRQVHDGVVHQISIQLLLISLVAILIALYILGKIAKNVTRPISMLAKSTEELAKGEYENVHFPDMGNRKDEIAVLVRSFEGLVQGLKEKENIRAVLNKVVSKDVADAILKTELHLGGEDRVVTMLFSDIRGFTKLTENLPPQKVIGMLNTYMTKMSRVIEGEGGVIDKYVGDEIMALYGAPAGHPDHAVRAVSSALLMMETLKKLNEERLAKGEALIDMGIGIHTGIVVAGNMGAEDRLNYTVLGANVNLANRLCAVAKPMQILITEATFLEKNVKDSFYAEPLAPVTLRGITEPVKIYEIKGFRWG